MLVDALLGNRELRLGMGRAAGTRIVNPVTRKVTPDLGLKL